MPAIDLARLKTKTAQLADLFDQPAEFVRAAREIFEFHADRTLRPGQIASPVTVLPSYNAPVQVLRQIEMEITPLVQKNVEQALALADALWAERTLEMRLLAAHILGRVPPRVKNLNERLNDWVAETREPTLRRALLSRTLENLRAEAPERFLRLVGHWLAPNRPKMWSNGIQALLPLLKDPNFENLPPIYEMLRPVIEAAPPLLQGELTELLNTLYRASPIETQYYLKQIIVLSNNPQTRLTLRRMLPALDAPLAEALRETLHRVK